MTEVQEKYLEDVVDTMDIENINKQTLLKLIKICLELDDPREEVNEKFMYELIEIYDTND